MDAILLLVVCFTSQIIYIKSTGGAAGVSQSILFDRRHDASLDLKPLFSFDTSSVLECTVHCLLVSGCSAIIGSPDSPKCRGFSDVTGTQTYNVGPSDVLYMYTSPGSAVKECPAGYSEFPINVCYRLGIDFKTQPQAEAACQVDGGTLMSLHTSDRYNEVSSFLQSNHPYKECFINAKKLNGVWTWADGSSIDTASHINPHVSIMTEDDCLYLKGNYWYGAACHSTRNYICEYEL